MSIRALHSSVYDALVSFPQADQFSSLAHAHVRNLLADHLTGVLHHDGWVQRDGQPEEKATAPAATATPELNDRQVRLLDAIRGERGHWKTGRVVRFYQHNDFHGAIRTARTDLVVLRDAGHVTQHDTKGVRFFTYRTKGSRS